MGFAEGTGLLWLAGMANGVRFFAPPYWNIEQAESARRGIRITKDRNEPETPSATPRRDRKVAARRAGP